jgi:YcxB-like protein
MDSEEDAQPIMKVSADIRRWDLIVFNLYMVPRIRMWWVGLAVVTAVNFYPVLTNADWSDASFIVLEAVYSAFLAAIVIAAMFSLLLAYAVFNATDRNGQLGTHVFNLRKDGLHEQTRFNEALHRWQGVYSITVLKHWLYIRLSLYSNHIVPASAFTSHADFERFSMLAREFWSATKSP